MSLSGSFGINLRKYLNNESSSTNDKVTSQDLGYKVAKINEEKLPSFITTEIGHRSCFQEKHCEHDPKSQSISDVKENILLTVCHPAVPHSEVQHCGRHPPSPESFLHDHGDASELTSGPKDPPSNSVVISTGKESYKMSEKTKCKNCEAGFHLAKIIPIEKNQEVRVLNENSKRAELSSTENYVAVTLPSVNVQCNQNENVTVIQKDQEQATSVSKITVISHSEELFQGSENDTVFEITAERNIPVLENMKELHEADLSCVKGPVLKNPPTGIDDRQTGGMSGAKDSDSSNTVCDVTEKSRNNVAQQLKMTLGKDSKSNISLDIHKKSNRNNDCRDKWAGLSGPISNHSFGSGFRTASDKEIKLSEHNLKKSKVLFKDIEEHFCADLACVEIVNTSSLENKKKRNKPRAFNSQSTNTVPGCVQSCVLPFNSENSHTAPPTLKQDFSSNNALTPSQKAEITELSTMLEESGSQFEFTQFRKPSHVIQNNPSEMPEDQMPVLTATSEQWNHPDLHLLIKAPSASQVHSSRRFEGLGKFACSLQTNCNKSASGYLTDKNLTEVQFRGFHSARGTKLNVSSEALQKAMKLFSDIEDISEETSAEVHPRNFSSSKCNNSVVSVFNIENYKNDKNLSEKNKCQQRQQNNIEMITGTFAEENTADHEKDTENEDHRCAGTSRNTCNLGESDGSDSSDSDTVYVHKDEHALPYIDQQNTDLRLSSQFTKEGNTHVTDSVSDATCLEVIKAEETFHVNMSKEEQLTANEMGQNIEDFDIFDTSFQTASGKNLRVSKGSLNKIVNFFDQKCTEELNNFSDALNSEFLLGINVNKTGISSHEETDMVKEKMLKESGPVGIKNQSLTLQPGQECEIRKIKGPAMLGFQTASGKKVEIAKESLDKVKTLFDKTMQYNNSEATNVSHQGARTVKDKEECKEGLEVACETADITTALKYEEMQNSPEEKILVSSSMATRPRLSGGNLYRQTEPLRMSNSSSLKIKVRETIAKETTRSSTACYTNHPTCSATENSALAFYTGHGRKTPVSQTSLLEAKKWLREGELGDQSEQISAAKVICLKEYSEDHTENPSCGNRSNTVIPEKDKNHLSETQGSTYLSNSSMSNSYLYHSDFCHSNEVYNESESLSKNKIDNSGIEPVVKNVKERKITGFSEVISTVREANSYPQTVKEDTYIQKSVTNSLLSKTTETAMEAAMSNSDKFEAGPPAFRRAGGQLLRVSCGTEVGPGFTDRCPEVIKQNTQSQSGTGQTEIVAGDESQGIILPDSPDTEERSVHSHEIYADTRSEQSLQHRQSMSTSGKASEKSPCQVNLKTPDTRKFNVGTLPTSASSKNACGIFITASGKSVEVSDAALQKARQVFSKLDEGAERLFSKVPSEWHKPSEVTREEKATRHNPQSVLPSAFSGFSTASGKQVPVSERALNKVKGMLEEFDCIQSECGLQRSPTSHQGVLKRLPVSCTDKRAAEHFANPTVETAYNKEPKLSSNCDIEIGSSGTHSIEVPPRLSQFKQDKQQWAVGSRASLAENSPLLCKEKALPKTIEMEIGKTETFPLLPVKTNKAICSTTSKGPDIFSETEAVEIAKAFMADGELTDSEQLGHPGRALLTCPSSEEMVLLHSRTGKRRGEALASVGKCLFFHFGLLVTF